MLRAIRFAPLLLTFACVVFSAEAPIPPSTSVTPLADASGDGARLLSLANAERRAALSALAAPTRIDLGATTLRVSEVLTKLNASGNPTTAAAGVDLSANVTLPQTAAYWELLTLLCERAQLRIKPGFSRGLLTHAPDGLTPIALVTGPVELDALGASSPQLLCASGALLVETTACTVIDRAGEGSSVSVSTRLRLEPRVPRLLIAGGIFSWKTVVATGGAPLSPEAAPASDLSPESISDVYAITLPTAKRPDGLALDGDLLLTFALPWRYDATLAAGDVQTVLCGRDTLELHADRSGSAGAKTTLEYPGAGQIQEPELLRINPTGERINGDGAGDVRRNGALAQATWEYREADWPLRLRAHGLARLGTISLPAHSVIDFTKLPATPAPRSADIALLDATRVELPAGRITLGAALAKLGANGNTILLDLGANEDAVAEIPAFSGTFWSALNLVCRTWDLTVVPPVLDPAAAADTDARLTIASPIRLRPDPTHHSSEFIPSAALGFEQVHLERRAEQRTDGINRQIHVQVRMRGEPRLDAIKLDRSQSFYVILGNLAVDAEGRCFPLQQSESHSPGGDILFSAIISDLNEAQSALVLSGMVTTYVEHHFVTVLELRPGELHALDLGGVGGWAALLDDEAALANGVDLIGLLVHLNQPLGTLYSNLQADVTAANGDKLLSGEDGKMPNDADPTISFPMPRLGNGVHHVTFSGFLESEVGVPFTLTIPPP